MLMRGRQAPGTHSLTRSLARPKDYRLHTYINLPLIPLTPPFHFHFHLLSSPHLFTKPITSTPNINTTSKPPTSYLLPPTTKHHDTMSEYEDSMGEVDIIFAGGGTAACVAAGRLAKANPELKIVLVEGGKNNFEDPTVVNPAIYLSHLVPDSKTALVSLAISFLEIGAE